MAENWPPLWPMTIFIFRRWSACKSSAAPEQRLVYAAKTSPHVMGGYAHVKRSISITTPSSFGVPESSGQLLPWVRAKGPMLRTVRPPGQQAVGVLKARVCSTLYYLDPKLTAERFRDGWFYPQDRARIDARFALLEAGRRCSMSRQQDHFRDVDGLASHPAVREPPPLSRVRYRRDLRAAVIATPPVRSKN